MTWLHALLLGVLEGLTEFLPVSSTGHLHLFSLLLGHEDELAKSLEIIMQLGAIIAVMIFYRARLASLVRGIFARDPASLRLLVALMLGFAPAAVVGLLFHKAIEKRLMSSGPIGAALLAGGVAMVVIEAYRKRNAVHGLDGLEEVTPKRALTIGLFQCLSLWPGSSRSMTTIVGGQLAGLSTSTAAEFSFLLSIPTLGAATLFKLYKDAHKIFTVPGGTVALAVSMATSFVVAFVVIAGFLGYLKKHGLAPFGWYRIVIGVVVLVLVAQSH